MYVTRARLRPGAARVPAAAPITLRAPRGIADLAIGLAEAPDAEASLDAVMGALRDERPIAAAVTAGPGRRKVAKARDNEGGRIVASASTAIGGCGAAGKGDKDRTRHGTKKRV